MDAVDLFAVALNLPSPWHISQVEFKPSKESSLELHIYIAFQRGGRFPCPQEPCGKSFPAYRNDATSRSAQLRYNASCGTQNPWYKRNTSVIIDTANYFSVFTFTGD